MINEPLEDERRPTDVRLLRLWLPYTAEVMTSSEIYNFPYVGWEKQQIKILRTDKLFPRE